MSSYSQNNVELVTFTNEPKFTEHEADRANNDKRRELVAHIKDFIAAHELFRGKQTEVTFSHSGISSLVCILNCDQEKFVLKIPLKIGFSKNESVFLNAWERVGVKVPHVIDVGEVGGQPYMIMEHIDSLTLSKTYSISELIKNEIYVEMGATLRKMHTATAEGYGDLINGKPQYPDMKTWLEDSLQERHLYVKEHELLNDVEHGSLEDAYKILFTKIDSIHATVYGHSDFHIGNIFATEPLTVFDPIPFLNHPYMDLARSIILAVKMGLSDVTEQMIRGYFGSESHDSPLLQAALIINVYQKLKYWHLTNEHEDIKQLQKYLAGTVGLLKGS